MKIKADHLNKWVRVIVIMHPLKMEITESAIDKNDKFNSIPEAAQKRFGLYGVNCGYYQFLHSCLSSGSGPL